MLEISDHIKKLRNELDNKDFDIQKFDNDLNLLFKMESPNIIIPLLSLFRDGFEYSEALFSVVHLIESYDNETYVRELISGLPELEGASKRWLGIVVHRLVNNEACYLCFLKLAQTTSDTKILSALHAAVDQLKLDFKTNNGDRLANDLRYVTN